jgi:IPT/TIG domain
MKTVYTILLGTFFAFTLACGYSSKNYNTGTSNMPAIAQLNPGSTTHGDPAFTLTVNGSNFATKAVVNWNQTAQTTTYVTNGQLTIAVPAAAIASAGSVQITVTNPATSGGGMYGGGGSPAQTSNSMTFTIN